MHLDANFWLPCNVMVCRALLPRISIAFVVVNRVTHLAKGLRQGCVTARPGRRRTTWVRAKLGGSG
jgi:hypothetical protein